VEDSARTAQVRPSVFNASYRMLPVLEYAYVTLRSGLILPQDAEEIAEVINFSTLYNKVV